MIKVSKKVKKYLSLFLVIYLMFSALDVGLIKYFPNHQIYASDKIQKILKPGETVDDTNHLLGEDDLVNHDNWFLTGKNYQPVWYSDGTMTLVQAGTSNAAGYGVFKYAMDLSHNFSFQVDIKTGAGEGTSAPNEAGDSVGIVLTPQKADQFSTGTTGGGLGLVGLPNSVFIGRDLHYNKGQDSSLGRTTSAGIAMNTYSDQFAIRSTNETGGWSAVDNYPCAAVGRKSDSTGDTLSLDWKVLKDNGNGTVTGKLTSTLEGKAVEYAATDQGGFPSEAELNQEMTLDKSMTMGFVGATGRHKSELSGSVWTASLSGLRGTSPVKVNYLNTKTGEVIAAPTTIIANVGETYGAVKDTSSFVGSDTYDYVIPSLSGYSYYGMSTGVSGTAPAASNNSASVLVANNDDADNEINVYYNQLSSTSFSFSYASGGVNYPPLPVSLTFQGEAGTTIPDIEVALRSKIPAGYIATHFTDSISGQFLDGTEGKDLISDVGDNFTPSPYVFGSGASSYTFTLSPMKVQENIRYTWDDSVPEGIRTDLPYLDSYPGVVDAPLIIPSLDDLPTGFYAKVLTQSGTYYGNETTTPEEALNLAVQSVHGPSGVSGTFAAPTSLTTDGASKSSNDFTIVLFSNGTIDFTAPDTIDFGSHRVSSKTETYEGQLDKNVDVKDARLASKMTSWSIQLNEDPTWGTDRHGIQEVRFDGTSWIPTGGVNFEGYLKYNGVVLSDTPQTVYNSPDSGYVGGVTTVVNQSKPSPFTLEVPAGLQRTNTSFIGKVQWTLSVTP